MVVENEDDTGLLLYHFVEENMRLQEQYKVIDYKSTRKNNLQESKIFQKNMKKNTKILNLQLYLT